MYIKLKCLKINNKWKPSVRFAAGFRGAKPKDISVIDSMQEFNGVYHVLDGLINTQKGVLPDQLNIMSLLKRINENTEEVILALDPTVEGETTALYISKLLEGKCRVSRLAHGIPVGSHLDYTDAMTLLKAFEGRKSS